MGPSALRMRSRSPWGERWPPCPRPRRTCPPGPGARTLSRPCGAPRPSSVAGHSGHATLLARALDGPRRIALRTVPDLLAPHVHVHPPMVACAGACSAKAPIRGDQIQLVLKRDHEAGPRVACGRRERMEEYRDADRVYEPRRDCNAGVGLPAPFTDRFLRRLAAVPRGPLSKEPRDENHHEDHNQDRI